MYITHLVLALLALFVGIAHSWDIAVSLGDRLEFYTNGNITATVHFKTNNLTEIAYDEIHNMMLFIDKQSDNDAICGYTLDSMEARCFIKRHGSNIQDLAFDPATQLLFFTDTKEGSINWISLKNQGSDENVYGNLLIKMDDSTVKNIAVDSCRGYIYWTNTDTYSADMERARFDGSEREVIYQHLPIYSFAIDPQTHNNYYIDGLERTQSSFYRQADLREKYLDAEKTEFKYISHDNESYFSAPNELTVSKNYLYWINSSNTHITVWQKPKNSSCFEEPRDMLRFYNERQLSIAVNYRIRDQVEGLEDCEALSSLIPTTTAAAASSTSIVQNKQTSPTRGKPDRETYVPACEIYCLQGSCTYNDGGLPQCSCQAGDYGDRCQFSVCHGYCLNDGECGLNEENEPVCACVGNYEGSRCETIQFETLNNAAQNAYSTERNLTLADLLSGRSTAKVIVTVEIKSS